MPQPVLILSREMLHSCIHFSTVHCCNSLFSVINNFINAYNMISSCVSLTLCLIYKLHINMFMYVQEKLQCKVLWYTCIHEDKMYYWKKEIKKQRKGKIIKGSAISRDTIQSKYSMSLIIVHKNYQFYLSKAGALASNPLDIRTRWDPTLDMKKI